MANATIKIDVAMKAEIERLAAENTSLKNHLGLLRRVNVERWETIEELQTLVEVLTAENKRLQEYSDKWLGEASSMLAINEELQKDNRRLAHLLQANDINSARECYDLGFRAGWGASAIVEESDEDEEDERLQAAFDSGRDAERRTSEVGEIEY